MADVLQLLGTNGSSGTLRILSKYATEPGYVYLNKGNPVDALSLSLSGLDALYALFGWNDGRFEFLRQSVTTENVINKNRMEIILDALRMLDEGAIDIVGPESFVETSRKMIAGRQVSVPIIHGPIVNYWYIVDEEEFEDGEKIIEEGKFGNWMWVVLEGAVDIVRDTSKGPITILRLGSGSFIGSMASFLPDPNVRSASTIAVGNVQLGVLDSQRLANEYSLMTNELKSILTSLDRRLKQINSTVVNSYQGKIESQEGLISRQPVFTSEDKTKDVMIITRGDAVVARNTEDGPVILAHLYEGDFLGNLPFLEIGHEPFSAAVYGSQDLKTEYLDTDDLLGEYDKLSSTFMNLVEHLGNCISVTTKVACDLYKPDNTSK